MQIINTKSLRLQLFDEVHATAAKTRIINMVIIFEICMDENTKQLEPINTLHMW